MGLMDNFLGTCILPKVNQEQAEILLRLITAIEIETVQKTPGTQKPWMGEFQRIILQNIYCDQFGFIPRMEGWDNICKPINIIHRIN